MLNIGVVAVLLEIDGRLMLCDVPQCQEQEVVESLGESVTGIVAPDFMADYFLGAGSDTVH